MNKLSLLRFEQFYLKVMDGNRRQIYQFIEITVDRPVSQICYIFEVNATTI